MQGELCMSVKSEDDIPIGSIEAEELITCILACEHLIVTLSGTYVGDARCQDFSVRAYALRPHALVPIALPPLSIAALEEHALFEVIIRTNGVIFWSEEEEEDQDKFWAALEDRLKGRLDSNVAVRSWKQRSVGREMCCALSCNKIRCCGETYRLQIAVTSETKGSTNETML